jgi:glucokinase
VQTYGGIEIGGTKLQLVLGDAAGKIHRRVRLKVDRSKGAVGIRHLIEQALPELLSNDTPKAFGVGFGGPVEWQRGTICRSHQIEGWSEFDLAGWLGRATHVPIFVDNDANVAALGEARHGAGRGFGTVFYVTLGSGVGGGLVVNGKIYHGAPPGEAEIGHLRLDHNGNTVESKCSGWAVDRKIRESASLEPNGILAGSIGSSKGGEAMHMAFALQKGDKEAARILHETGKDLAFALSHVVHLFHPEVIILGGGLSGMGEPLRAEVERALRRFIMEAFARGLKVVLAALGEDAVPVGALALASERIEAQSVSEKFMS